MKVSFAAAACDGCELFRDRAFAGSAIDLLTRTGSSLGRLGGWYGLVGTVFATQPGDLLLVPVARDLRMTLVTDSFTLRLHTREHGSYLVTSDRSLAIIADWGHNR
jgi:hypothetical protein